jgi:hypothetical protein
VAEVGEERRQHDVGRTASEDEMLCGGLGGHIRLGSEKEKKRYYFHSSFVKPSIKTASAPQLNLLQETIAKAVLTGTGVLSNGTYKQPMQPCCTLDLTRPLLSYSIQVCFVIFYKHFHLPYFFFIYFFYYLGLDTLHLGQAN